MNKELNKFYTPGDTAQYCIDKTKEVLGEYMQITEWLEPSAGAGAFSHLIDCVAYDIAPEAGGIIQADYLKIDIPYKKGRVIFGNPPFGTRGNLARSFYKKSAKLGDAIAFILPITQLNNVSSLNDFELVYSENLGVLTYSGTSVYCCFNIYFNSEKPKSKKYKSPLFDIFDKRNKDYESIKEDFFVMRSGYKIGISTNLTNINNLYKIVVHDKSNLDMVYNTIKNTDWLNMKSQFTVPYLSKDDIHGVFNK